MKCKITFSGGNEGEVFALGELDFEKDGFSLRYTLDGDECLLICSGGTVSQERRGSVPLKMQFSEGRQTVCTLGMGGLSGSFTVNTKKLEIEKGEKSVKINLVYVLSEESVNLRISAAGY